MTHRRGAGVELNSKALAEHVLGSGSHSRITHKGKKANSEPIFKNTITLSLSAIRQKLHLTTESGKEIDWGGFSRTKSIL